MSDLSDKLLEIKRQKDEYILPENLKKDVTVYGVTGTLESSSGFPSDIHIIDCNEQGIAVGDFVSFGDVISATTNTSSGVAKIIDTHTNNVVELTNTTSPNIRIIYKTNSNKYIVATEKELNLYNNDFTFNSNIYTHTDTNYSFYTYFYEYHKGSDGYIRYMNDRYVFICCNGLKVWYYDTRTDELNTIEIDPSPNKYWDKNFVECNGYIYSLDYNNNIMYKYDFNNKSLTTLTIINSGSSWAGEYYDYSHRVNGVDFIWYRNKNSKIRILLNNGTFSDELSFYVDNSVLHDSNFIYYSERTDNVTTFKKFSLNDGTITNYATFTGEYGGSSWNGSAYIYNNIIYTQGTKPLKINTLTGEVQLVSYTGTDTYLNNLRVGTDILYFDRKNMYKLKDDGVTLEHIYKIDEQEYGYMCEFTDVYEFTGKNNKRFALLYSTGRNMIWWQKVANYNFGAMIFIYDFTTKQVEKIFPYDTGPTCVLNTSGNGMEFSYDIIEDVEKHKIYIRVVPPTEDGMSYKIFGGSIFYFDTSSVNYVWEVNLKQSAALSGPNIGKQYMFVGDKYICDGLNMWLIDAWKDIDVSPDWWNYYHIIKLSIYDATTSTNKKQILYVTP